MLGKHYELSDIDGKPRWTEVSGTRSRGIDILCTQDVPTVMCKPGSDRKSALPPDDRVEEEEDSTAGSRAGTATARDEL